MSPGEIALCIPFVGLSIPLVVIWTKHLEKMAEIRSRRVEKVEPSVLGELEALRAEVAKLRDTSTRFDMSFDAAITALEKRMVRVETQDVPTAVVTPTPSANGYSTPDVSAQQVVIGRSGGQT